VTSSPIEDLIIVCTDDGLITLRDHETLAIRATFLDEGNWPMAVHVIPGCSFMVTASYDGILKLWDIHNHREIAVLGDHEDTVRALASTPDGSLLLSGSDDGILKVWNLESREIVRTLRAHEAAIHSIATDSHGELAVSASMDGIVRVWRLGPFDDDGQFGDGKVGFSAVAVLPGDKHLIAGSVDGDLMRWRLGDRKKLRTFSEPSGAIKLLSLTEDRRHLISVADWGDYVTLWNCEPWKALTWIELIEDILRPISVYSICVVQRKNRIVTGSEGGVIQIRDGQSFSALDSLQYGRKYINSVDRIDVSGDGARAVSLEDGMIRTWDLERMELAGIWYVSGKKLTGCAIASAGDIVVATDPAGDLASVLF
jgi:WD40 repeat protein